MRHVILTWDPLDMDNDDDDDNKAAIGNLINAHRPYIFVGSGGSRLEVPM
jgi:hypothetical protein